jgi:hypothetical protein
MKIVVPSVGGDVSSNKTATTSISALTAATDTTADTFSLPQQSHTPLAAATAIATIKPSSSVT